MTDLLSSSEKLNLLREQMEALGLDGFLIPLADENQGEYVPAYAQRLAWLTRFTGSAGLAIVTKQKAAIFVDGRYTLQVANEADPTCYEFDSFVVNGTGEWPPAVWLETHLGGSGKLGYDPWLHTENEVERFSKACRKLKGELVSCAKNPIDTIWINQPTRPRAPLAIHPEKYAGKSSQEKRNEIALGLEAENLDAVVLAAPDSIAWLLNIRGGDVEYSPLPLGFAIFHKSGKVDLFMEGQQVGADVISHLGADVSLWQPEKLGDVIDKVSQNKKRIALSKAATPSWIGERIKSAGGRISYSEDPCVRPKACKNEIELSGMRSAHERDGAAMVCFLAWLEKASPEGTLSEIQAADKLEECRSKNDLFQGLSFPTISGAGPNGAIVHYRVDEKSNSLLLSGNLYLVDSGGQYFDGTTDITRTIAIGTPSAEMKDRFTRVLKGHIALSSAVFPANTSGSQLDGLARGALWAAGLDYDHGTGHGVGSYLSVHEGPQRISKLPSKVALEPGMVLSNEPGYYKVGAYGIRIENLLAVVSAGEITGGEREMFKFEPLTLAPIDKNLIDKTLLSDTEISWLNDYHAEVYRRLSPLVSEENRAWLDKVTEPLAL
ncbi:MAG: aminopeptidase P family protein [Rhodospirillales bacterium]|nr:aminopeptidase P family protein [Rhodospirillales bacterium]